MERKVGGSYDYLCRRVASLFGLRRGGSSRDAASARWLCRPSVRFESASHTPRGQRQRLTRAAGCLGTVSSEPRQDRPPWRRRVEGLGQGENRWLQPRAHHRERRIWPEIFGEAMRGWEQSAEHKRNLPLPEAQAAGIAVSYQNGRAHHTLVLGAE